MVKVISRGSSLRMNDGSVTLKRRQKRQPVEGHHTTSSRSYPFSRESPWPPLYWGGGDAQRGQAINSALYIHTREPCRSLSGELGLTKMLLKSSSDTTTHGNTQVRKHRKQSHNWETFVSHPLPYIPDFAPSDLHVFVPLRVVCGKSFGNVDEVIEEVKKWLQL